MCTVAGTFSAHAPKGEAHVLPCLSVRSPFRSNRRTRREDRAASRKLPPDRRTDPRCRHLARIARSRRSTRGAGDAPALGYRFLVLLAAVPLRSAVLGAP